MSSYPKETKSLNRNSLIYLYLRSDPLSPLLKICQQLPITLEQNPCSLTLTIGLCLSLKCSVLSPYSLCSSHTGLLAVHICLDYGFRLLKCTSYIPSLACLLNIQVSPPLPTLLWFIGCSLNLGHTLSHNRVLFSTENLSSYETFLFIFFTLLFVLSLEYKFMRARSLSDFLPDDSLNTST